MKKESYFHDLLEVKHQNVAVTITIWVRPHLHLRVDNQTKYEIKKLKVRN
jgi:hypothetical protein